MNGAASTRRNLDDVDAWIAHVWERRGTDLLLTAGAPPLVRIDGSLAPIEGEEPLTPAVVERIVNNVIGDALIGRYDEEQEVDFAFAWRELARLRGNAFHQRGTCALSLRIIPYEIPGFDMLGLPPVVEKLVRLPQGLVIVTGPTGSGKSTTLASMLDWVNRNRSCHIVTIEDPIEYHHAHGRSAVTQREVGTDTESFGRALRSALREDPDVLLVGEMRDLESIQTTITIAETGHLVFATLHTNDTAQALDRIVDVFPSDRRAQVQVQLASTLEGVIYQRLVPKVEGGMIAAYEVMIANHAVRNLVREGKTNQLRNILTTHRAEGMQSLEMSLGEFVARGIITPDSAAKVSLYPQEISMHAAYYKEHLDEIERTYVSAAPAPRVASV
ncbi:MAG: type IV pilus twitching motility protein PilT [Acidimicrobiales bacterium]